ncbi:MAG TPA: hypothetical protein VL295_00660 [Gemmatimonadales bacterium]|nr:hypothetical protein [Gemmatimonadales bacterium]
MSRGSWVVGLVLVQTLAPGSRLWAQTIRSELGIQAYGLFGDADGGGGGLYLAHRAGPRGRISLFAGAGGGEGGASGRAEALVHLLVSPARRRGAAPYLAGGLGLDIADRTEARLVALIGLEGSPGGRRGWVLEGGVGGGWRLAAGWRWRR